VNQFKGHGIDLNNIDRENNRIQMERLKELVRGRNIDVENGYVRLAELPPKSHEHSAVMIIEPFYGRYADIAKRLNVDLGGMYVLQALDARDLLPDMDILKMLGFGKITLIELGNNNRLYEGAASLVKEAGMKADSVELTAEPPLEVAP
jgi:hypothetical protein